MLNLTPHAITLRTLQGDITFPPSGTVARVETRETPAGLTESGFPVVHREKGDVIGIPEKIPATGILVSSMVLEALRGTPWVYAPDTGSTAIRNGHGHIVAVTRLVAA